MLFCNLQGASLLIIIKMVCPAPYQDLISLILEYPPPQFYSEFYNASKIFIPIISRLYDYQSILQPEASATRIIIPKLFRGLILLIIQGRKAQSTRVYSLIRTHTPLFERKRAHLFSMSKHTQCCSREVVVGKGEGG